jgi:hypothetical protein
MKTRTLHPRLSTLTLTCLLPLLALASTACGAAPDARGDEPVESTPPSPVEEGSDAGSPAQAQGGQEPTGPLDPGLQRSAPAHAAGLRPDQAPSH